MKWLDREDGSWLHDLHAWHSPVSGARLTCGGVGGRGKVQPQPTKQKNWMQMLVPSDSGLYPRHCRQQQ